ncbi:MAG: flagellar hook-associated protein FlgK [Hyphomicrobium sp.]|jgi:flagellar hook-associated protein 1 FlgK
MSLTLGLSSARSSLLVTGDQTSVISRNIANADTPLYSRKSVQVVTVPGSGVRVSAVTRAEEPALFRSVLAANSDSNTQSALLESLDELNATVNDVELDASPAGLISKLVDAVQGYSAQPQSKLAAEAAVRAARNLSDGLNSAATVVQNARRDADTGLSSSVTRINSLLEQFDGVNKQIIAGTRSGADITDYLDNRDKILQDLSEHVGIRTVTRSDNDTVIYTDSGATLFERDARTVEFKPSVSLTPGQPGNAIFIDGVAVTGSGATLPLQSGRIVGLVQARDEVGVSYERQLDEISRGLISAFAESDQTGGGGEAPGLFTYSGASDVPASGIVLDGLASRIRVNASVDPDQGGDATRLRDGGVADPSSTTYVYNSTGSASYSDRLNEVITKLTQAQSFDGAARLSTSASLTDYSASSVAWLQEARKVTDNEFQYRDTLFKRSSESHSKLTGVNIDEELATLLELERSYQTSSKLISVIDNLYNTLISALG